MTDETETGGPEAPEQETRTEREIEIANAEPHGSIKVTLTGSMAALTPGEDDDVAEFFVKEGISAREVVGQAAAFVRGIEGLIEQKAEAGYRKQKAAADKASAEE